MTAVLIWIVALIALLWVLIRAPLTKSLAEEERELREYFRKRDAAERVSEIYPK